MKQGQFDYINKYYGLSVKRGSRCIIDGKEYTVISSDGLYLWLKDSAGKRKGPYHPTDGISYIN